METWGKVVITIVIALTLRWGWKVLNWAWLKPKKLEKWLRDEGYKGNSYNPLLMGDMKELSAMVNDARSKPLPITHDITSSILPFDHHIITKYGKKSFLWLGPNPRMYIWDLDLIKEILSKPDEFQKPHPEPFRDSIIGGLLVTEGHKWIKHRRIINPAFHLHNLKIMFPAICSSCDDMVRKWEQLTATNGSAEVDVWPYIDNLAGDVISRTAFGSSYEEGKKIFGIQKEQINLLFQMLLILFLPGKSAEGCHRQEEESDQDGPEGGSEDLLGILLESNSKEIKENGVGMSMDDVIEECKLFYVAGSETTSNLIVWTMVCLSLHQEWQTRARREILQVFGTGKIDFEGLKNLKILTMILNEVLRLYPPVVLVVRATTKDTKLGNMMIPAGVYLTLPIIHIHHDREIWGEDAAEFKPERFSEGVSNATKGNGAAFFPFTSGPRVCIGQNFAMAEAKAAIATILQRFSCEISPSYKHSPFPVFTLPPQFGAHLILSKKSFLRMGTNPRMYIWDLDLIKEILSKPNEFQKPHPEPFQDSIVGGLLSSEGHKWIKHRKIINPAFHLHNLKIMFPAICSSCDDMVRKWEQLTATTGSAEVDVWPYIDNLAGDVISRTAFGSCYEEGKKIFGIQKEQINLLFQMLLILFLPGRRFIPTTTNKKFNKNRKELRSVLKGIIDKRKKAIKTGSEGSSEDLLGILLESNSKEIEENGVGMSMDDVIEECKLFYVAGSETTSNLIVWTMVCLSLHQEWQTKLDEKSSKFSVPKTRFRRSKEPQDFNDDTERAEFKPERFSEGVLNATKGKGAGFFPFTSGPRVCIGQNFAMAEAKAAIATILQRFSCEISPSYKHSPFPVLTLPPQSHLILRKIS
ncbi:hypothetical protein OSB04_018196 [Centaurea solstitialis]|uniref:Cytochrome P450 n=1 Tax=Centaurea solstitialis TaxID=347529 RepID=A0AA38WMR4_9ASTR|nr:hypothetical protein OSB04_018196 [Centaurea solstitialis]